MLCRKFELILIKIRYFTIFLSCSKIGPKTLYYSTGATLKINKNPILILYCKTFKLPAALSLIAFLLLLFHSLSLLRHILMMAGKQQLQLCTCILLVYSYRPCKPIHKPKLQSYVLQLPICKVYANGCVFYY